MHSSSHHSPVLLVSVNRSVASYGVWRPWWLRRYVITVACLSLLVGLPAQADQSDWPGFWQQHWGTQAPERGVLDEAFVAYQNRHVPTSLATRAETVLRPALEQASRRPDLTPAQQLDLARAWMFLGEMAAIRGNASQCAQDEQQALRWFERAGVQESAEYGEALASHSNSFSNLGRFDEAVALGERAVGLLERVAGPAHVLTGRALESLGLHNRAKGQLMQALPLFQRALAISEKTEGLEHPDTGTKLKNLAMLHREMGQYAQALPLLQRALIISEKAQGPEHPSTGIRLNNLAMLHQDMGEYNQALPLLQRALVISEKSEGPEHPNTGISLNNLALLHRDMGQYAQALSLLQRALVISEKSEGPEHPNTGNSLNSLALLHQDMGQYDQALPLVRRALIISEKTQGSEHPITGTSLNVLATLHQAMGEYAQALPLLQRALVISEKTQGPEHPDTGTQLNNLAMLHRDMGQYAQALSLLQRALVISEKTKGPEHPNTGISLNNLALLHQEMGQYAQALPLLQRALIISEKSEGPEHPNIGMFLSGLAMHHHTIGQYAEALPLLQRALVISEKTHGAEHPNTGRNLSNLAMLYRDMGQYTQALPLMQRALVISEKSEGPEHPRTSTQLNNLALLLLAMGKYAEALPLMQRALVISEKSEGPEHPNTGRNLINLAMLHQAADALPMLQRGLIIAERYGPPELLWNIQSSLMVLFSTPQNKVQSLHQPALAIWFGKQAVNTLQGVRSGMKILDSESQQSFLKKHEGIYTYLSNLLIEAGRLAEAEQVLTMLKEYELTQLLRSRSTDVPPTQVGYVGAEVGASEEQRQLAAEGVRQATEMAMLRKKGELNPLDSTEQARLDALEKSSGVWRADYQRFLSSLGQRLTRESRVDATRLSDQQRTRLQDNVALDSVSSVGLHYSVSDSAIGIIVATPHAAFGRISPIRREDLNRQVAGLRQAILNRTDTRPAAQALWQMLIAPVQADLQAAGAKTVVLSLTDILRYLPFAALQDPQGRYLVQDYALSLWAAAGRDITPQSARHEWQITGLGVSQAHPGYDALPAVRTELHSIVRTDASPGGLLPGRIVLDEAFNLEQFDAALRSRSNVLHVASHFTFRPGDEHGSGMLLGSGALLSLSALATKNFSRFDQLTLSACDTATGGGLNENGAEVEGLAATVLRDGKARAVMATLWKVADNSTARIMRNFYALRAQAQPLSRAQALRQAQLALLEAQPDAVPPETADRQASRLGRKPITPVQADPARPFAHPYYWAPFVLSGDWR